MEFSTRDLAGIMEYSHANVLAKVKRIAEKNDKFRQNIRMGIYLDGNFRNQPYYLLTATGVMMFAKTVRNKQKRQKIRGLVGTEYYEREEV